MLTYFNVFRTSFGFSKKEWYLTYPYEHGVMIHFAWWLIIYQKYPDYEEQMIWATT